FLLLLSFFCLYRLRLLSFPTRRSSDLLASNYYQVKIGGDVALFKGVIKALLTMQETAQAQGNSDVLDLAFIAEHTNGFEALSAEDRKSTRVNSSHVSISYAVFCVKQHT